MDNNKQAYSSQNVVEKYSKYNSLQKGEIKVFEKFKNKIIHGKVLDIGIGAGRTTNHLLSIVKEYIGVDFSQPFVDYCKTKFKDHSNLTIQYGDARQLDALQDHDFDFILFSFNGIDYVDFEGRKKILNEFSRLLKTDGVLCFSFHNKNNLDQLYSFQFPRNPFKYFSEWTRMKKILKINGKKENYKNKDWFIFKDGGENFTISTFYIDAFFQRECLRDLGFTTFYFHDAISGKQLNESDLSGSTTPWLYISAHR